MTTSNSKPERVTVSYNRFRQKVRSIAIDITVVPDGYVYDTVPVPPERYNYEGVVDALVSHKFPTDKMQAIINNYLLDVQDEKALREFREMQLWRSEAKQIAREIFPE